MDTSDSKIEFEPDLADKEVVKAQPLMQMEGQQDVPSQEVKVTHTYISKELWEFLENYQQKNGKSTLARILWTWDGGAVCIHLLVGENNLLLFSH